MAMPLNIIPPMIRLRYRDATPLRSDSEFSAIDPSTPELPGALPAGYLKATCKRCGLTWCFRPHRPASLAGKDLFRGTGSNGDRYVFALCPDCGEEWIGDLGFSGAISRGPECLQASQHYEWDDEDE